MSTPSVPSPVPAGTERPDDATIRAALWDLTDLVADAYHSDPATVSPNVAAMLAWAAAVVSSSPATPPGRERADRAEAWIVKIAAELCESAHGDGEGGPACQDCYDLTCSMLDTPTVGEWFAAALDPAPSTLPAETRRAAVQKASRAVWVEQMGRPMSFAEMEALRHVVGAIIDAAASPAVSPDRQAAREASGGQA